MRTPTVHEDAATAVLVRVTVVIGLFEARDAGGDVHRPSRRLSTHDGVEAEIVHVIVTGVRGKIFRAFERALDVPHTEVVAREAH